jgi:hypothetical protein
VVAHSDLDADAAPLNAARNGYTEQFATEFNSTDNLDVSVDAEAWAFNDGVDLGGSLETYERQEPGLCVSKANGFWFIKSRWPRRTVFERDDPHGLDSDRDKLNLHLDATSDDNQVQEHARRHLARERHRHR